MKKIFMLIILLMVMVTGCVFKESEFEKDTIHYNLYIGDYYTENITFTFSKDAYDIARENINSDYDSLEFILLVDNFSRPIHNNLHSFYEKNISRLRDAVEVKLSYDYIEKDFTNSNYMSTCFEKHTINDEDDYFEIHLSGEFYCLQNKVMTIEVESMYDKETSNGNKVDDKYQWVIKPGMEKNTDIYYKVERNKKAMLTSHGAIASKKTTQDNFIIYEYIIIFIVLIVGFFFYKFLYSKEFHK